MELEEDQEMVARLQRDAAYDVIIQNYKYLVEGLNAVRIFPHLVQSGLVNQDFLQHLDGERTDKNKMMALLRELNNSPMECWFKEFIGALSKISQYEVVADTLQKDFTEVMVKKLAHQLKEDGDRRKPPSVKSVARDLVSPPLVVNVSGVDEVMKKALEDAQAGHKAALSELQKLSYHLLEAQKIKVSAETEKKILEDSIIGLKKKLKEAIQSLKEAEMQKRLFEKETHSYKEEASENQKSMHGERMQLSERLVRLQSEMTVARESLQDINGEKATLETKVASLQAEADSSRRKREEEVSALQQQLSDAKTQQQTVEDELKRLWKEMGEAQQRCSDAQLQAEEKETELKEETKKLEMVSIESSRRAESQIQHQNRVAALEIQIQEQSEFISKLKIEKEECFTEVNELRVHLMKHVMKESMVAVNTSQHEEDVEVLTKQLEASKSEVACLAAEVDDMYSTQELAMQELNLYKQESMEKGQHITELEAALEHRKLEAEAWSTEHKLHDRSEEISVLHARVVELEMELEVGRKEVVELRERLCMRQEIIDGHQQEQGTLPVNSEGTTEAECIICHEIFNKCTLQEHVNGHFED